MSAYELSYATAPGRCAWCWQDLPRNDTHTVIRALRPPPLELHMHHACFDAYRYTSGLELAAVGASSDWPPERLEQLRMTLGWDRGRFCRAIGAAEGTYRRILEGEAQAFGPGLQAKVKQLASRHQFESRSPIDWSDPRALFCLRMTLGWKYNRLGRTIGASVQQIGLWERHGVPGRSVRTWGRLAKLAGVNGFAASDIVDDHSWTTAHLAGAIAASGRSHADWGVAAGCSTQAIQQWAAGTRPIHRESAWRLSRAAWRFGVPLPPVGRVGYRKGTWTRARGPTVPAHEAKRLEALREAKWTLDQLLALGTMPDREVAPRLGKTRNSVAIMRRALGIAAVDARFWDGQVRPPAFSREELQHRWDRFRDEIRARGRESRARLMTPDPEGTRD